MKIKLVLVKVILNFFIFFRFIFFMVFNFLFFYDEEIIYNNVIII